jgi:hypothetical protein
LQFETLASEMITAAYRTPSRDHSALDLVVNVRAAQVHLGGTHRHSGPDAGGSWNTALHVTQIIRADKVRTGTSASREKINSARLRIDLNCRRV